MVIAGCLLAPAAASASSVRVVRSAAGNGRGTDITKAITYRAGGGELNRLIVTYLGSTGPDGSATRRYSVEDSGATISVGAGCVRATLHRATCSSSDEQLGSYDSITDAVDARLEDGADTASIPLDADAISPPQGSVDVTVDGGSGNDAITVPKAFATIDGGSGSDQIEGSDRTDFLNGGGGGRDVIHAGAEPDFLEDGDSSSAPDADLLDGGANPAQGDDSRDVVSYARRTRKVSVDLAAGVGGQAGEGDQLLDIEGARGGRAGDVLRGDSGGNALYDGPETSRRRGDRDRLIGGHGADVLISTAGRDSLSGRSGADELDCSSRASRHSCRISGGAGADFLGGTRGNDRLSGGSGKDTLFGHRGNDRLAGGSGRDRLLGGSGRDRLISKDHSADRVDGGSGRDRARVDRRDIVKRVELVRR